MKILIVAHDAGGAEIVSAWVKANPLNQYYFILEGPAVAVFSRKILNIDNYCVDELVEVFSKIEFVLTGTSWGSDLERNVIKASRKQNIFVASYLDHWVNYLERFLCDGEVCLPNEIWVGDSDAENLAKNIFKETPVRMEPNQYYVEVKNEYKKIVAPSRSKKYNLLYICEPVEAASVWKTGNKNSRNYTEFSALEYFFNKLNLLKLSENLEKIKLRLHPSEHKSKYDRVMETAQKKCLCEMDVSENTSLLEDYAWADYVVGISSMALVIAAMLEKKVFTCVPENVKVTKLPLQNIFPLNKDTIFLRYRS